jgi:hypothetical protein
LAHIGVGARIGVAESEMANYVSSPLAGRCPVVIVLPRGIAAERGERGAPPVLAVAAPCARSGLVTGVDSRCQWLAERSSTFTGAVVPSRCRAHRLHWSASLAYTMVGTRPHRGCPVATTGISYELEIRRRGAIPLTSRGLPAEQYAAPPHVTSVWRSEPERPSGER